MHSYQKLNRYKRIYDQLEEYVRKCDNPISRMATIAALLHHKMDGFFWTGFYLLNNDKLQVGPYQGPIACQELAKDTGVCWAGINQNRTIIVPDVHKFPGHIACDSRSKSEIVIPVKNNADIIMGILDIDSKELNTFDQTDAQELEKIVQLIYKIM